MKVKTLPSENEILTRTGRVINPLNVQNGDISILDVVHSLPLLPMFGGQTRKFYSMAEHCANMYDYLDLYIDDLVVKFDRNANVDTDTISISDIKKRHLRLFSLLYYAPYPFLINIAGGFKAWNYHYPRILAVIVQDIGLNYEHFKISKKLLDYVDNEVRTFIYDSFNSTGEKYLFVSPYKAQQYFISRFNKDCDIEIKTKGHSHFLMHPETDETNQLHLNFNLPTITI